MWGVGSVESRRGRSHRPCSTCDKGRHDRGRVPEVQVLHGTRPTEVTVLGLSAVWLE